MIECVIDTHVLGDLLMQYSAGNQNIRLKESNFLTKNMLQRINVCVESDGFEGVVVSSAFAFIEIVNQIDNISGGNFDLL